MPIRLFLFSLSLLFAPPLLAQVSMPAFFSNGMVLQQETTAKLWGWAEPGTVATVNFQSKSVTGTTSESGEWVVEFQGLKASQQGANLTIKVGSDTKTIKDVVVGEVWIGSGQSNMEWTTKKAVDPDIAAKVQDNLLRVYVSGNSTAAKAKKDFPGKWLETKPENTARFTAVGYHFAKELRTELNVPIGIIECAWGGKRIESFISESSLKEVEGLQYLVQRKAEAMKSYSIGKERKSHKKALAAWAVQNTEWKKEKKGPAPKKPRLKTPPSLDTNYHSTIFNGMIAPLAGYSARGAIWYQGESNAHDQSSNDYRELLKLLIHDWQKQWSSNLSFYYVQLANYDAIRLGWVTVQDQMRLLLHDPEMTKSNIGMAVINDIGTNNNIHPPNKMDVGKRLARWALKQDYHSEGVVVSGPLFKSSKGAGNTLEITFDYAEGLKTRDGMAPGSFELIDAEGNWLPAIAEIQEERIVLQNTAIPVPTKARYAWTPTAKGANLINAEGLPTSCFTTE